jgi:glycerol-3-phosphate acyltransferase PlsY
MDTKNILLNLTNLVLFIYIIITKYLSPSFITNINKNIFDNIIFKIIILFIMVVINKPTTSVLICIFYIINIQTNLHEGFNKSEKVIME